MRRCSRPNTLVSAVTAIHSSKVVQYALLALTLAGIPGCDGSTTTGPPTTDSNRPKIDFIGNARRWVKYGDYGVELTNLPDGSQRAWLVSKGDGPGQLRVHYAITKLANDNSVVITRAEGDHYLHTKVDRRNHVIAVRREPRTEGLIQPTSSEYCAVVWDENGIEPIYQGPPDPGDCTMPPPGAPQDEWGGFGGTAGSGFTADFEKCCYNEYYDREFAISGWGWAALGVIFACPNPLAILTSFLCASAVIGLGIAIETLRRAQRAYRECGEEALYGSRQAECAVKGIKGVNSVVLQRSRRRRRVWI